MFQGVGNKCFPACECISWLITIHFEPGNIHPSGVSCLLVVAEGGPLVREYPFRFLVPETCFLWGDMHDLPKYDLFQTWKHHREWLIILCNKWKCLCWRNLVLCSKTAISARIDTGILSRCWNKRLSGRRNAFLTWLNAIWWIWKHHPEWEWLLVLAEDGPVCACSFQPMWRPSLTQDEKA